MRWQRWWAAPACQRPQPANRKEPDPADSRGVGERGSERRPPDETAAPAATLACIRAEKEPSERALGLWSSRRSRKCVLLSSANLEVILQEHKTTTEALGKVKSCESHEEQNLAFLQPQSSRLLHNGLTVWPRDLRQVTQPCASVSSPIKRGITHRVREGSGRAKW